MGAWLGFLLIVTGGIMQGSYFLGLKYVHPWKWENVWLVYSICGLLFVPIGLAVATVPHLGEITRLTPAKSLLLVFVLGMGWGVGSVLAGLGVDRVGMALGISVLLAITAALGTFVPFVLNTPDLIFTRKGLLIVVAVATLLAGVALVAVAGKKRDMSQAAGAPPAQKGSFAVGLTICIFSGIFSPMVNFAFAFSQPVAHAAVQLGASPFGVVNAVWLVTLLGGFIPNGLYACYLLTSSRSWGNFALPGTRAGWWIGAGMGILWTAGLVCFGRGGVELGRLGAVIGFPVFLSSVIVVSNLWGFATGEWKYASSAAKSYMVAGCVVLTIASGLLGVANVV